MNNFFHYTSFILSSCIIVFGITFLAYIFEKVYNKKHCINQRILNTRKIAFIGLFSAISSVLMLFEIPLFFAPQFYKIDLSEVPILILAFGYGPVAGVITELIKILIKLVLKPSSTAFVGELANYIVGCSYILPIAILYKLKKTKKMAIFACVVGGISMTFFGSLLNVYYLLPTFAIMWGCDLNTFVEFGRKINHHIVDIYTLVLFAVVPLNIIKSIIVSFIVMLNYKRIRSIL